MAYEQQECISHSSGKLKIKVPADPESSDGLLLGSQTAVF